MPERKKELISGAIWLAFGLFVFWRSLQLSDATVGVASGFVGPAFYPRMLAFLIVGVAALYVARILWRRQTLPKDTGGAASVRESGPVRVLVVAGILVVYTVLLDVLGYLLLTPLLLAILMWILGERRWRLIVSSALLFSFGLYFVFQKLVNVILPENLLF